MYVGELVKEPGLGGSVLEVHVAQCERENRLEEPVPGAQCCRESRLWTWRSPKRRSSGLATGEKSLALAIYIISWNLEIRDTVVTFCPVTFYPVTFFPFFVVTLLPVTFCPCTDYA